MTRWRPTPLFVHRREHAGRKSDGAGQRLRRLLPGARDRVRGRRPSGPGHAVDDPGAEARRLSENGARATVNAAGLNAILERAHRVLLAVRGLPESLIVLAKGTTMSRKAGVLPVLMTGQRRR